MVTGTAPPTGARTASPRVCDVLQAILFDSGGVLMQPIGGRWNPRADFEDSVLAHAPQITSEQFAHAIAAGERFFGESSATPDYDDYHCVLLRALGIEPTSALLADLNRPVDPATILETFPEVLDVLGELRARGVRIAVVSDAWPNLPDLHAALGIDDFVEVYAISAILGCTKPDPRMYRHASDGLRLSPAECVFVDDDPRLVAAAIELGYEGRTVCRNAPPPPNGVPSITTLDELLPLFA
jgi:putative hydrolase of the HAD superfamily